MKEFVFDIETAGYEWDKIDDGTKAALIKKHDTEDEARKQLGLNPLISKIIVISVLDMEKKLIMSLVESEESGLFSHADRNETYNDYEIVYRMGDERTILEYFWKLIEKCRKYITFNGRHFDIPFIIYRSMIHQIKPTRKLMANRYHGDTHFDIYDQLTFYSAAYGHSLEMWCNSMGITNPKEKGIDGSKVGQFYREGKIMDIAQYCNRDVIATGELYERIKDYF